MAEEGEALGRASTRSVDLGRMTDLARMRSQVSEARHNLAGQRDAVTVENVNQMVEGDYEDSRRAQLYTIRQEMAPAEAARRLLKHISVDPDGGVVNIGYFESTRLHGQKSKIAALEKNGLERFLAFITFCRIILNPLGVLITSGWLLWSLKFDEAFFAEMRQEESELAISIPLPSLLFCMSIFEFVGMLYFVILFLRNNILACAAGSTSSDEGALPYRYVLLSRIFWEDIPHLQTFSAMKILAMVHPALIARNLNEFTKKNKNARKMLVEFFSLSEKQASSVCDEELIEACGELIIAYQKWGFQNQGTPKGTAADYARIPLRSMGSDESSFAKGLETPRSLHDLASSFSQKSIFEMAMLLYDTAVTDANDRTFQFLKDINDKGSDSGQTLPELNPEALNRACCLRVMATMESVFWILIVVASYILGACTIFVKMVRCVFLLKSRGNIVKAILQFILFMNQVIGVISVMPLLRWRVETAIFGGQDAFLSAEERYIVSTWRALIVEKVVTSNLFSGFDKLAVLFQFDDNDIQQLIMEENTDDKLAVIGSVKKYMAQHHAGGDVFQCNFLH
mmetsp:Transcript_39580/g.93230  ORF Transcript_39580/g.93230 Transcript_39580/m.93230 type:complete len:569 (-) Transcript_39580:138-1844(-)